MRSFIEQVVLILVLVGMALLVLFTMLGTSVPPLVRMAPAQTATVNRAWVPRDNHPVPIPEPTRKRHGGGDQVLPITNPDPTPEPEPTVASYGGYPATAQGPPWVVAIQNCIIEHESSEAGGYLAFNPAGPAYGAYQILPSTGDGWADRYGFDQYVGVLPTRWPPEIQDKITALVIQNEGVGAWNGSGC